MKRKLKTFNCAVCLLICLVWNASGQSMHWPEDTIKAKEQYALLSDNYRNKDYKQALGPLNWLLDNAPDLHENLYIIGINISKNLIEHNTNYYDIMLQLYRDRIHYYGHQEKLNIKMLQDAYRYRTVTATNDDALLVMYDTCFNKYSHRFSDNLLLAYMVIATNCNLGKNELTSRFIKINNQFETIFNKPGSLDTESIEKNRKLVNQLYLQKADLNCEQIHQLFGTEEDSNNEAQYKIMLQLAFHFDCTSEPWFPKVLERLYNTTPTYKTATYLADKALQAGTTEKAYAYYHDALKLANDSLEQVRALLSLSSFYSQTGNHKEARKHIVEALMLDPGNTSAYEMWGNLYYNSFEECKQGKSRVHDRSVYLAAWEKYKKAGNHAMMRSAASQFPAMEDIHQENYNEGDSIMCECWINEKVVLKRRVEY